MHNNNLSLTLKTDMGLFDFLKKDGTKERTIKALSSQVQTLQQRNLQNIAANINRNIAVYPSYDTSSNAERFATSADVNAIISRLAVTAALIPIYAYKVVNDEAAKKLSKIKQPHNKQFEVKALQVKAFEDLPETDRLQMLIENPSETYSTFSFYEAVHMHLLINGNAILLKERPQYGLNAGLTVSLIILYPQNITLKVSDTFPRKIVAYDYTVNTTKIYENIPPEDIIHIKYFNPQMDYAGSELWGLSPLLVLKAILTRIDSGMNTSVAQLQNGGVTKIVYDKSLTGEEAVEIVQSRKDNMYRFLKNPANHGSPFMAAGEMGVLDIGSNLDELGINSLANIDFKKLCNVFGTSDILFNSDSASTESNVTVMEKRTYTNTVLPNVYRVRDALKMGLLDEFEKGRNFSQVNEAGELETVNIKGDGIKRDLREDISEIPSLQANMLDMAQWMTLAWWVTANEKRLMMKFERIDSPMMDEPLLPSGVQTLEDLEMIEPLEQVTESGL